MSEIGGFIMIWIPIIILTIVFHKIYHKLFDVVYFSFSAYLREWAICLLIATFLCCTIL